MCEGPFLCQFSPTEPVRIHNRKNRMRDSLRLGGRGRVTPKWLWQTSSCVNTTELFGSRSQRLTFSKNRIIIIKTPPSSGTYRRLDIFGKSAGGHSSRKCAGGHTTRKSAGGHTLREKERAATPQEVARMSSQTQL